MATSNRAVIITAIGGLIAVALGIAIGYFGRGETVQVVETPQANTTVGQMILNSISAIQIENNLRTLAEYPHIAGREVDEVNLVNFVAESFRSADLSVEIYPYEVLLSYPEQNDSNFLAISLQNGTLVDKSQTKEKILDASQDKPGVVNPFNAYAKSGDPEGELVYVNYGTVEDFQAIPSNINLAGKICIARYGKIFRGDKALNAENSKCAGLIIYSDPFDYAVPGEGVYPNSWYLPGTGAQRGTLFKKQGDPLTLNYPSIDTAWRAKEEDVSSLPGIPVTPIGYDDAILYLSKMGGAEVPESWRGRLNITYRYGPGFTGEHKTSKMRMHVTTTNQQKITHNVVGYIKGFVEPDRYVIIGNHRDAWIFGAMDPSSGTATILEVARAFGEAVKNGWKPRRTIIFCSWGAEEYALIGSTEWIEEYQKVLGARSVVYINADTAVAGTHRLNVAGSPNLKNVVFEAAKFVPNPNSTEFEAGRTSTYDTWRKVDGDKEPTMNTLGSGSDYTTFLQLTGISCLDLYFVHDQSLNIAGYPVYHSVYETFDLVKTVLDPHFKFHQAAARVIGEMARNLADTPLLPFSAEDYVNKMISDKNNMLSIYGESMRTNGNITTGDLDSALTNLSAVATAFHRRLSDLDMTDALALRAANDQLMFFERAFIDKLGVEGRDQYSHVIYAPSLYNSYGAAAFPGLVDSMFGIGNTTDPRWNEVRRQFSVLLYHIGSAASTLEDVSSIKGYSNKHSGYHFK